MAEMARKITWVMLFLFVFLFVAENVGQARCRGGRRGWLANRPHRLRTWWQNRPHRFLHR